VAQPVTAILSTHAELAAKARAFTGDANEAGLLVGKVVGRALDTFKVEAADDVILHAMQRDLDAMIEKLRRTKL
jgi:DNA-binding LytR/AlgR family response regulator